MSGGVIGPVVVVFGPPGRTRTWLIIVLLRASGSRER